MKTAGILATLALVVVMACSDERASTTPFAPTTGGASNRTGTAASASDALDAIVRATDAAAGVVRQTPIPTVILFNNGSESPSFGGAVRNHAGLYEQYEDFRLSQRSIITSIHWRVHAAVLDGKDGSTIYGNTELRIFDGLPYTGSQVFSGPFVANRSNRDFAIAGLSITLDAGTYWLGLNDNTTTADFLSGWATTPGGPNTIPGSRTVFLSPDCGGGFDISGCGPGRVSSGNFVFRLRGRRVP